MVLPNTSSLSRRRFLTALGSAGAGALLSSWLPSVVDKAYAASEQAGHGSLADIEHFVFLMQENRSFDHYFGTLSGVRGFDDPTGPTQVVGGKRYSVFQQFGYQPGVGVDPGGYMLPFAFQSDATHDDQCLNDPTHDWGPQHRAWNGGRMDQWLTTHCNVDGAANGPIVMGYYDRSTLPFYYRLADAFTVCDNYHCSVLGPTYPNRAYWMSGTLDPDGQAGGPILATLSNVLPDPTSWGYFHWKTMPEVLEEAGISWKVYQSTDAVGGVQGGLLMDNILRLFQQYSTPGPLMEKGLLPTLEKDFPADVATGQLPQVSWIVTDFTQCEHPAAPPSYGGVAVAYVLDLLTSNPELWAKTAFIVNYDENGGFFDHVPPPVAPPGTPGEYVTKEPPVAAEGSTDGFSGPIGLGFRVPCLVISPYSRGGLVYSGVLDHTSELRLLETRFGTRVPNLSAWRRAAVGDLTGAFDFASAPDASPATVTPVIDPYLAADLPNAGPGTAGKGIPYPYPTDQAQPRQEPGTRRRPSGPVHGAAQAPSQGGPNHVEPDRLASANAQAAPAAAVGLPSGAAPEAAAGAAPASTDRPPATTLAMTGSPVYDDVVKGAALLTLGTAVTAAAAALPARRPPVEEPAAD
ncbi:MAG TPA: alkaline phosphatase family protein [Acidimicrobiales bacterium]|nr:alkaline phosphatase family protein [Acidimicrobiales bacterium]